MEIPLILASTSKYRQTLMEQIGLTFQAQSPLFNEVEHKNSELKPAELALFLSEQKARSLATKDNCVVGGDQLVELDGAILGKPGNYSRALEQLKRMSGKTHYLHTALTVIHCLEVKNVLHKTTLQMKNLSDQEVENYLKLDSPYDCAGSYKIEQNGKSLFSNIECDDFSAIQGLPLIHLTRILKQFGYTIPNEKRTS